MGRFAAIATLFFFSGLSSLVLETVWTRQLVLVFGSTTFAISSVLTAFMAGLAGGSLVAGRRVAGLSRARAMRLYGGLELVVGLYALALPWAFDALPQLHAWLWGVEARSYHLFALLRFLLVFVLLAPPTFAMGATLPILTQALVGGERTPVAGRAVGGLYAVNTAGAVLGVFLAGFVLLPAWGTRHSTYFASFLDVVLAVVAFAVAARLGRAISTRDAVGQEDGGAGLPSASAPRAAGPVVSPALRRFALISIAISGAVAMAYEVAWTRSLTLVVGSSTYAFSLILIAFLLGLSAGAALYARRQVMAPDQGANLAVVHLLTALTALGTTAIIDKLPAVLLGAFNAVALSSGVVFALKFIVVASVVLLPALFMGMVLPAVVQIWSAGEDVAGRAAGVVYGVNTLGAIVGSFLGGFVLVPFLGLQRTLALLVTLGAALAVAFAFASRGRRLRLVTVVVALMIASLAIYRSGRWDLHLLNAGVFRVSRFSRVLEPASSESQGSWAWSMERRLAAARRRVPLHANAETFFEPSAGYRLIRYREGVTTTVGIGRSVTEGVSSGSCWLRHSLLVNGKPDASLGLLLRAPATGCSAWLDRKTIPTPLRVSPAGDAETQMLSGMLPLLLHPRPVRRALVIGWGSGVTVGAVLKGPQVAGVVAVELEKEVLSASRVFQPENGVVAGDPRLKIIAEDGRNVLASRAERYDVVISEPSNPWMAGCGNLFTREFFLSVRERLAPGGIFLQWLQAYEIAPHNVWSILGTLSDVFPSVSVFTPARVHTDLLLVARRDGQKISWPQLTRRLALPAFSGPLAPIGLRGAEDVIARLRADPARVRELSRGAPRNTDDNARIEFQAPRDLIEYQRYSSVEIVDALSVPITRRLQQIADRPADQQAAQCWAELSSGRRDPAMELAKGAGSGSELARCGAARRLLAAEADLGWARILLPDPLLRARVEQAMTAGRPLTIVDEVLKQELGTARCDALLGYLMNRARRPYAALTFALAAWYRAEGMPSVRAPAAELVARLYGRARRHDLAVLWARRAQTEISRLSTAKVQRSSIDPCLPTSAPTSAPVHGS